MRSDSTAGEAVAAGVVGGALAAATAGWCAHEAGQGATQPDLVERHEWSGIAAAFLAAGTWIALRRGIRSRRVVAFVLLTAVIVSLAGHWGGVLTWGDDFLPFDLPF